MFSLCLAGSSPVHSIPLRLGVNSISSQRRSITMKEILERKDLCSASHTRTETKLLLLFILALAHCEIKKALQLRPIKISSPSSRRLQAIKVNRPPLSCPLENSVQFGIFCFYLRAFISSSKIK